MTINSFFFFPLFLLICVYMYVCIYVSNVLSKSNKVITDVCVSTQAILHGIVDFFVRLLIRSFCPEKKNESSIIDSDRFEDDLALFAFAHFFFIDEKKSRPSVDQSVLFKSVSNWFSNAKLLFDKLIEMKWESYSIQIGLYCSTKLWCKIGGDGERERERCDQSYVYIIEQTDIVYPR